MNSGRKMTPRGQMSSSGSGPAIMMMPNHIRATFMPDPPLKHLPPPKRKRPKIYPDEIQNSSTIDNIDEDQVNHDDETNQNADIVNHDADEKTNKPTPSINNKKRTKHLGLTGISNYMAHFERDAPPPRKKNPTPVTIQIARTKKRETEQKEKLKPIIESYRKEQQVSGGECQGMNCYNTLFVGRLAFEVTERKLLREFEGFGPVKDLKLVTVAAPPLKVEDGVKQEELEGEGKSRGYAFIEYEREEDMKKAYRAADGMRIEGRNIVVDVERGHTVPNWLPRRLGGGLGGTRLGSKDKNVTIPGRFDPSRPPTQPPPEAMGGPPGGYNGGPPPMMMGGPGGPRGGGYGGPGGPPGGGGYGGRGPPGGYGGGPRGGGGGGMHNDRGPPPQHQRGMYNDRGGGGGPPPPGAYYGGGPPPPGGGRYGGGGGGGPRGDYGGGGGMGMKRGRERSRSPDTRGHGRRRY